MRSPYAVLGVRQSAGADDIKSAYRQLAMTWHPDRNGSDPGASERFAEIAAAYRLLADPHMRTRFDQGEIDARGRRKKPRVRPSASASPFTAFREAWREAKATATGEKNRDPDHGRSFDEMMARIFGEEAIAEAASEAQKQQADSSFRPHGTHDPLSALDELFQRWKTRHRSGGRAGDTRHVIEIPLEGLMTGHEAEWVFGEHHRQTYSIAPGTPDGTEIRIPSPDPYLYGDAVAVIRLKPDTRFRISGRDLLTDHPIDLADAILGGKFSLAAPDGPAEFTVPEWSGSDKTIRLDGRGLPDENGKRGALLIHLRIVLPSRPDQRLVDLMRSGKRSWYL